VTKLVSLSRDCVHRVDLYPTPAAGPLIWGLQRCAVYDRHPRCGGGVSRGINGREGERPNRGVMQCPGFYPGKYANGIYGTPLGVQQWRR
jgi:hypothetical protein